LNLPRDDWCFHIQKGYSTMYLIAIAWIYVVLMMALAEALSAQGTVLGAIFTFLLYGCLPLSIVMYLLGTPMRRRARLAAEAQQANSAAEANPGPGAAAQATSMESSSAQPDGGSLPPRDAVPAKREEG
jgi:hypothetical protein